MAETDISAAYTSATARVLAQVRQEALDITQAAQTLSQEAKKKEDLSALAVLRAKVFGTKQ